MDQKLQDIKRTGHHQLFEAVCASTTSAIFLMDERQHCIYMNPAAEAMTGYFLAEVQGRPLHDVIHHKRSDGSAYPIEDCPIGHVFPQNTRKEGEETFVHKHGHLYPVAYTASPVHDAGGISGTIIEVRDISAQKKTERELRQSEEFSRRILQSSQDCIKVLDLEGRLQSINLCGLRVLSIENPEDVRGASYVEFWGSENREQAEAALEEARNGGAGRFTGCYRTPSGKETWWDELVTPVCDADGNPERLLVMSRDITERTVTEQALRKSEERFQFALDSAHVVGTWDWDIPNDRLYADERVAALFSIDPEEAAQGAPLNDYAKRVHPDDIERVMEDIRRTVENASEFECEYRVLQTDGSVRWVLERGRCHHDHNGNPVRLPGVAIEITDRKLAEQAIRDSEERLRATYDNVQVGICEVDLSGKFLRVNDAFCRIIGYEREDVITMTFADITHPDDAPANLAALRELHAGQLNVYRTDKRYLRKDGTTAWVSLNSVMIRDEAGTPVSALTAIEDITERKSSEERQQFLLDELNHRVKNMLATVQSIASQTLRGDAVDPEVRAAFEDRLFALSQAHSMVTRENWERVSLLELATQALGPYKGTVGDPDRILIEGEPINLRPKQALALGMAFHELAANAAKYGALSNDSGKIFMTWDFIPEDTRIHLRWRESGGPPVESPEQRGFGSRLIERGLAHELQAKVNLDFQPEGLACLIDLPAPERRDA